MLLNTGYIAERDCILGVETFAVHYLHPACLLATAAFAAIQTEDSCPCYLKNFSSTLVATSSELSIRELQHEEFFLASAPCWCRGIDLQS